MKLFIKLIKKFNKKPLLNDKGSAIVTVIIAMGMIGILASTILWTSYLNYMIKLNDKQTKDNFYSAENVVEQIMAGMKNEASYASTRAYKEVMARWAEDIYEVNRQVTFSNAFRTAIAKEFIDEGDGKVAGEYDAAGNIVSKAGYQYDREKLRRFTEIDDLWKVSFIDSEGNAVGTVKVDEDFWNGVDWGEYSTGDSSDTSPLLEITGSTLVFKNVGVKVTNEKEYVSVVTTDIVIEAPKLTFSQGGNISDFYDYTLIADEGISIGTPEHASGIVNVEGNIYAGGVLDEKTVLLAEVPVEKKDKSGNLTRVVSRGGMSIEKGSVLNITDSKYIISGADINLKDNGSELRVAVPKDDVAKVFANNINVNGGTLNLSGRVYASDDLTLQGSGSNVVVSGEYYGYGQDKSEDPDHSSAIIINGNNSKVDFSKVTRLFLAGRAYISGETDYKKMDSDSANPAVMGESIAVKGGQIAYLVPAEAIGIIDKDTHKIGIGLNPLNAENITRLQNYQTELGDDFLVVDIDRPIHALNGKTLREYVTIDGSTGKPQIREVNVQNTNSSTADKTLRYYYLVMTAENAERYFKDYYTNIVNKNAIDSYFKAYASNGILLGDYTDEVKTEYTILGNALISSTKTTSGVNLLSRKKEDTPEGGEETNPEDKPLPEDEINLVDDQSESVDKEVIEGDIDKIIENITNKYANLTSTLNESISSGADATVAGYLAKLSEGETITISETEIKGLRNYLNTNGGSAKFTNGKYVAYFTTNDVSVSSLDSGTRLIVAINKNEVTKKDFTGPVVTVDQNYSGTIISEGSIVISNSVNVKKDKQGVFLALKGTKSGVAEDDPLASLKAMDFFTDEKTLINGANEIDTKLDWSSIVYYSNWYKK